MDAVLDAAYFRDKAETCLRLAQGLSWNNPARPQLMELAVSSARPSNSKLQRIRHNTLPARAAKA
jgi:hypothetical protein